MFKSVFFKYFMSTAEGVSPVKAIARAAAFLPFGCLFQSFQFGYLSNCSTISIKPHKGMA